MLYPNKYLKEIGIDENYWLFKDRKNGDKRCLPDEDGFVEAELFNLDSTFSMYIYSHLCYFRDHCLVGHPSFMTFEDFVKQFSIKGINKSPSISNFIVPFISSVKLCAMESPRPFPL